MFRHQYMSRFYINVILFEVVFIICLLRFVYALIRLGDRVNVIFHMLSLLLLFCMHFISLSLSAAMPLNFKMFDAFAYLEHIVLDIKCFMWLWLVVLAVYLCANISHIHNWLGPHAILVYLALCVCVCVWVDWYGKRTKANNKSKKVSMEWPSMEGRIADYANAYT